MASEPDTVNSHPPSQNSQPSKSTSAPNADLVQPQPANVKFQSYADYLESIQIDGNWPEYSAILEYFRCSRDDFGYGELPLMIAESTSKGLTRQSFLLDSRKTSDLSAPFKVFERITRKTSHLESQGVQIIMAEFNPEAVVGLGEFLDSFGLFYDIDPAFFHAALRFFADSSEVPEILSSASSNLLVLPHKLVAQVLRSRNFQGQEISIVLVFWTLGRHTYWNNHHSWLMNNRPSMQTTPSNPIVISSQRISYLSWYTKLLETWHSAESQLFSSNPYLHLSPVIRLVAQELHGIAFELRDQHSDRVRMDRPIRDQKEHHLRGESIIEKVAVLSLERDEFELFTRRFKNLSASEHQQQSAKYGELLQYIEEVLEDVNKIIRLVREQMQTEIGLLSIQESRRSIDEAISVKRLTQLAFVFIPLSFVTSVFGMNVQEISGNGVKIWIFVVTSVIVGGFAILFWRLIQPIQRWWARHPPQADDDWKYRLQYLWRRIGYGEYRLLRNSGYVIGIISGGRFGPRQPEGSARHYYGFLRSIYSRR